MDSIVKLIVAALIVLIVYKMMCARSAAAAVEPFRSNWDVFNPYSMIKPENIPAGSIRTPDVPASRLAASQMTPPQSVDFLPAPPPDAGAGGDWGEFAPKALQGAQFVDATKFVGVNTIGSSLKNPNYNLRADPPIPKKDVGPWSNSTIDPDPWRKSLE